MVSLFFFAFCLLCTEAGEYCCDVMYTFGFTFTLSDTFQNEDACRSFAGLGTAFFSVLNASLFSVLLKNTTFFCKERNVLLQRT